jgi:CHAT domain-containing protein
MCRVRYHKAESTAPTSLGSILAKSVASRPFRGRLAGLPYRPNRPGALLHLSALPFDALDAAQRILKDGSGSRAAVRNRAALELWTGHTDRALSALLDASENDPSSPALWVDLSAVYLELVPGRRPDLRMAARALESASHAIEIEPLEPAGLFNRALALNALGLRDGARDDLSRITAVGESGPWAAELKQQLDAAGRSRDEWPSRRDRLVNSAELDEAWLRATAEGWPQETRELLENTLLPAWGREVMKGNDVAAHLLLQRAQRTATQLAIATRDPFLLRSIDAIITGGALRLDPLARGHVAYADGLDAYEATDYERARATLAEAERLLSLGHSPFVRKAQLHAAVVLYQLGRFAEVERAAVNLAADAERDGFLALFARASWLGGLSVMQRGRVEDAIPLYRRSRQAFEATGEREDLAGVAGAAADTLRRIGEHTEGWSFLSDALSGLSSVRAPRRRLTLLLNASLYAADDGLRRTALTFEDASLRAAEERGVAGTIVEGHTRRARLRLNAGDRAGAAQDLDAAERLLAAVASPSQRDYAVGWLRWVQADWEISRNPTRAVSLFEEAKRSLARSEPDEVPRLSVGLGLAALRAGRPSEAARYLTAGLQLFEARWQHLSRDQYKVSSLDDAWRLFDALIRLSAIDRKDPAQAFAFAERGRARSLSSGPAQGDGATLEGIRSKLPEVGSLLYYSLLDDRLLTWIIERRGIRFRDRSITADLLYAQIRRYRRLIESGTDEAVCRAASRALYEILIPSELLDSNSRGALAIVGDGFLNTVPFATLVSPRTNRYLVEERSLLLAPSASFAVRPARGTIRHSGELRCLLVGGTSSGSVDALGPLPHAADEIREVARHYRATVLLDEQATLAAMRTAMRRQDVLHFAGHAVANESFPWRSRLLLAPDSEHPEGAASLDVLREVDFSHLGLVVLSACRTASGAGMRGEGVISLMRPFLQQRVPTVVGTLWDVDDAAARALLTRFHAAYVRNRDAVAALGEAQRDLLKSDDPLLRRPRAWGGVVVTSSLN